MSGVDQVLVAADTADAITGLALDLRSALRRHGESDLYARYIARDLQGDVRPIAELPRHRPVAYHAAIGEPDVVAVLGRHRGPIAVVYHNVSPAHPFVPFDADLALRLSQARAEIAELSGRTSLAVAVSRFNAAELLALGFEDVRVLPVFPDPRRLLSVASDPPTRHHLETAVAGPLVLFVGQILPHKRLDLVVEAYHVLTTYLRPDAHLVLAGPHRLSTYAEAVQTLIEELNLPMAAMTGAVADAALAAYYRRATVFVTLSEHEGVCVPLLEAMAFGVPVVTRRCAAIPETAGDGALLLPTGAGVELVAEALREVLDDEALRGSLIEAGRRRVESIDLDSTRSQLTDALLELA